MEYTATVRIKLQNYSGDSSGNVQGNFVICKDGVMAGQLGNINVQARVAAGEDPIAALHTALVALPNVPTLTEAAPIVVTAPAIPVSMMPPVFAPAVVV